MRKREQQDEKLMYEIAQENKRMSEPLRKARQVFFFSGPKALTGMVVGGDASQCLSY